MNPMLKYIKGMFKITTFISPRWAGNIAFRLFQKVRKKDIRNREKSFFAKAFHFKVPYENGIIDGYVTGVKKGETIFMMHGWDSNAGSMQKISKALIDAGHQVVAINLPGHAFSKKNWTNIQDCMLALKASLKYINPQKPIHIVSHSFGSAVVTYTLSKMNLKVGKLVFITSPDKIKDIFIQFKDAVGLPDKAFKYMVKRAENLVEESLDEFSVAAKIKDINFDHLSLIHDPKDKILPYIFSQRIHENVPNSSLLPIEKAGHYRILWRNDVVQKVLDCIENRPIK